MITAVRAGGALPLKAAERLVRLPCAVSQLAEVRLRAGRRAAAIDLFGNILPCSEVLSRSDIEECFQELYRHSVHSFSREIAEGYITLEGGHRAGFCGTAVMRGGQLDTLREVSCINLRLAREVRGCAEELHRAVFGGGLCSLLLAGAPMTGKTTLLRDLARILGGRFRVSLIDTRGELAAVCRGTPALDVGENTDILDGYPRAQGIECALRTLSPQVIICDELGSDLDAVRQCCDSGVRLVAAVHAGSLEQLRRRRETSQLLPLFDRVAVVGGLGEILELE